MAATRCVLLVLCGGTTIKTKSSSNKFNKICLSIYFIQNFSTSPTFYWVVFS